MTIDYTILTRLREQEWFIPGKQDRLETAPLKEMLSIPMRAKDYQQQIDNLNPLVYIQRVRLLYAVRPINGN